MLLGGRRFGPTPSAGEHSNGHEENGGEAPDAVVLSIGREGSHEKWSASVVSVPGLGDARLTPDLDEE
jgi:hypothetical protein